MMEYFWYILALVLARVGTGLVGLSAAMVTVPLVNTAVLLTLHAILEAAPIN